MHKLAALPSALACTLGLLCFGASAAPVKIGVLETLSGPQASSGQAYRTAVR
jgi:branched-chain amino acid transport system substrate-binding protein